jgi:glyoxylase-like metal-dependent hydrolase (beta-lactamase superfamily II)
MRQVADGVWQVPLAPRESVNAYVLGDVLVDAGTPGMGKKLPGRLDGHEIAAHTLTHAHPDHAGGSKAVLDALGVPFWAPAGDAPACENGQAVQKDTKVKAIMQRSARFPKVSVARRLAEGDEVGGFTVLDTPGHSPGHISFWREADRVLVCGDVWFHLDFKTFRPKLRPPFGIVTVDIERNRASQQRLADLRPDVVCFGHGPVLTDAAAKLRAF